MKKSFIYLFTVFLLLAACTPKALPTIPDRARQEVIVKDTTSSNVPPDLARGKMIFMNRCSRCHDLPDPAQHTASRWDGILRTMIPRARLNNEQAVHVTAYLKENAGK